MKKISRWAKDHVWSARIIIIVSILSMNVVAVVTGSLFSSFGISIPLSLLGFAAIVYAAGFIGYPSKRLKRKEMTAAAFYVRQKTCDLLLISSTFLMIVCLANHPEQLFRYAQVLNAASPGNTSFPKDSSVISYKSIPAFSASLRDEHGKLLKFKERKKLLKEQINAIKKSSEPSKGGKIALIILSCLVAGILIMLVASLACSLSCGGSDVAAVIVGIGGTALVVWLLTVVLKQISGKKKKPKDPVNETPGN